MLCISNDGKVSKQTYLQDQGSWNDSQKKTGKAEMEKN